MPKRIWPTLALGLLVSAPWASAAEIRDDAGMFKPDAVQKAEKALETVQRRHKVPFTIESVSSIGGESLAEAINRRAAQSGEHGVFVLLIKDRRKIEIVVSGEYKNVFNADRRAEMRKKFAENFQKSGYDRGLVQAVEELGPDRLRSDALSPGGPVRRRAGAPPVVPQQQPNRPVPAPAKGGGGGGLIGGLLVLGVIVLVGLVVIRLLGSLFRGPTGGYGPGPMAGPGGMGAPATDPGMVAADMVVAVAVASGRASSAGSAVRWPATGSTTRSPAATSPPLRRTPATAATSAKAATTAAARVRPEPRAEVGAIGSAEASRRAGVPRPMMPAAAAGRVAGTPAATGAVEVEVEAEATMAAAGADRAETLADR